MHLGGVLVGPPLAPHAQVWAASLNVCPLLSGKDVEWAVVVSSLWANHSSLSKYDQLQLTCTFLLLSCWQCLLGRHSACPVWKYPCCCPFEIDEILLCPFLTLVSYRQCNLVVGGLGGGGSGGKVVQGGAATCDHPPTQRGSSGKQSADTAEQLLPGAGSCMLSAAVRAPGLALATEAQKAVE